MERGREGGAAWKKVRRHARAGAPGSECNFVCLFVCFPDSGLGGCSVGDEIDGWSREFSSPRQHHTRKTLENFFLGKKASSAREKNAKEGMDRRLAESAVDWFKFLPHPQISR